MSSSRAPNERRIDAALLLSLWAAASPRPREDAGDKLRQMKLAFLAAHECASRDMAALHLSFFRWTWGPMSNEVYATWEDLLEAGLMESEEHFVLTRAGESLAEAFSAEVLRDERNISVRDVLEPIARKWAAHPTTAPLLDYVYRLEVTAIGEDASRPIRDIPKGQELVKPVGPTKARSRLYVDGGWLETLALTLTPLAAAPLRGAIGDFRSGRIHVA